PARGEAVEIRGRTKLVEPADDGIHGNGSARNGLHATVASGAARTGRLAARRVAGLRSQQRRASIPVPDTCQSAPHVDTPPAQMEGAAEREGKAQRRRAQACAMVR